MKAHRQRRDPSAEPGLSKALVLRAAATRRPVIINIKVPAELHRKISIICAIRGESLIQAVHGCLRDYVKQHAASSRQALSDLEIDL